MNQIFENVICLVQSNQKIHLEGKSDNFCNISFLI